MNPQTVNRASGAAVGILIVSVIFAVLVVGMKLLLIQPPIDAARADVRTKALAEIQASEEKALHNAGWIDQQRGIVRLPIDTALQLAAQQWQDPAAARAELTARAEKAAAELPKAPEKPSAFE